MVRTLPFQAGVASAYGLPHDAAIEAVTLGPAVVWGVDDLVGSLEPGKRADLVVTKGDLLEITTEITGLWIDGDEIPNWLDPDDEDGPDADPDGDGLNNAEEEATEHRRRHDQQRGDVEGGKRGCGGVVHAAYLAADETGLEEGLNITAALERAKIKGALARLARDNKRRAAPGASPEWCPSRHHRPNRPELPPAPALPEPLLPVFPAGFVEVLTCVLETLKLALAAVLTFTLGAEVLTTVELLSPLLEVLA